MTGSAGINDVPNNRPQRRAPVASKRTFAIFTSLFLVVVPNLHAAKCSNASLNGTYAYSTHGFTEVTPDISSAGFAPFAQTGLIVYDGHGAITSGTFTYSTTTANGGSFRGTFTGRYTVNGDCSGKTLVDLGDGTIFHFDLVVQGLSKHTFISTDAGGFISVYSFQRISGEKQEATQ
jgi:hypothetical protein